MFDLWTIEPYSAINVGRTTRFGRELAITEFAKVQSYAFKAAVLALAAGDAAGYLIVNRHLNEPVPYSEEVTDLIDSESTARPNPTGLAQVEPVTLAPTLAANQASGQPMPLAPAAGDTPGPPPLPVPAVSGTSARARPIATNRPPLRAKASRGTPLQRRAATMSFSQAFASYPEASPGVTLPPGTDHVLEADQAELPAQTNSEQGVDGVDAAMRNASQELNPVSNERSGELPALDSSFDDDTAEGPPNASPADEIGDRRGSIGAKAGNLALIGQTVSVAAITLRPSGSKSQLGRVATSSLDEIKTDSVVDPAIAPHQVRRVATPGVPLAPLVRRPETQDTEAEQLSYLRPPVPDPAARLAVKADGRGHASVSIGSDGNETLILRDVLIALRLLMSAAEFNWLIGSRNSAAVITLENLREAGIAARFDPGTSKISFV